MLQQCCIEVTFLVVDNIGQLLSRNHPQSVVTIPNNIAENVAPKHCCILFSTAFNF